MKIDTLKVIKLTQRSKMEQFHKAWFAVSAHLGQRALNHPFEPVRGQRRLEHISYRYCINNEHYSEIVLEQPWKQSPDVAKDGNDARMKALNFVFERFRDHAHGYDEDMYFATLKISIVTSNRSWANYLKEIVEKNKHVPQEFLGRTVEAFLLGVHMAEVRIIPKRQAPLIKTEQQVIVEGF